MPTFGLSYAETKVINGDRKHLYKFVPVSIGQLRQGDVEMATIPTVKIGEVVTLSVKGSAGTVKMVCCGDNLYRSMSPEDYNVQAGNSDTV